MTEIATSRLTIGGVVLPAETHLDLKITLGRQPSGRKTLALAATGWSVPALDAVAWSAPVTVTYADLASGGTASLAVLSAGVQRVDDLSGPTCQWSLSGVEATGLAAMVTIGGTAYWATVDRQPLGGIIQRKSNGAGVLLSAWGKTRVTITGEGGSAPSVSGVVAISSTLFTGNLLVNGVGAKLDPETGLIAWTVAGEQK